MSIKITEKPDTVSWDEIHELLWASHAKNREKGMYMWYPSMSGDELERLVGKNGHTFVAIDGDTLVGTCSFKIVNRNRWYANGKKTAYFLMASVLPEYQGSSVYFRLVRYRQKYIEDLGVEVVDMDTAENNVMMQKILLKQGYKYVGFKASSYGKHYSVVMAKWINGCPFPDKYVNRRFQITKKLTKWQYKPGKIERSRIVSFFCRNANKLVKHYYGD